MKLGKVIQYRINIEPTFNHGFIVKVGCGLLAFSNSDDLLETLKAYLAEPEKFEKEYNNLVGGTPEVVRAEREEACESPG